MQNASTQMQIFSGITVRCTKPGTCKVFCVSILQYSVNIAQLEAGGVSKGQNMHLYRKRKKCRRPYLRSAACSPAVAAAIADLGGLQEPL